MFFRSFASQPSVLFCSGGWKTMTDSPPYFRAHYIFSGALLPRLSITWFAFLPSSPAPNLHISAPYSPRPSSHQDFLQNSHSRDYRFPQPQHHTKQITNFTTHVPTAPLAAVTETLFSFRHILASAFSPVWALTGTLPPQPNSISLG